jgi:hypothetical protein
MKIRNFAYCISILIFISCDGNKISNNKKNTANSTHVIVTDLPIVRSVVGKKIFDQEREKFFGFVYDYTKEEEQGYFCVLGMGINNNELFLQNINKNCLMGYNLSTHLIDTIINLPKIRSYIIKLNFSYPNTLVLQTTDSGFYKLLMPQTILTHDTTCNDYYYADYCLPYKYSGNQGFVKTLNGGFIKIVTPEIIYSTKEKIYGLNFSNNHLFFDSYSILLNRLTENKEYLNLSSDSIYLPVSLGYNLFVAGTKIGNNDNLYTSDSTGIKSKINLIFSEKKNVILPLEFYGYWHTGYVYCYSKNNNALYALSNEKRNLKIFEFDLDNVR